MKLWRGSMMLRTTERQVMLRSTHGLLFLKPAKWTGFTLLLLPPHIIILALCTHRSTSFHSKQCEPREICVAGPDSPLAFINTTGTTLE